MLVIRVSSYRYLGTFVDSELNFIRQSNESYALVQFISYIHKSYIQPYFDYNDIFPETTTARQYDKLVCLQRCCLGRCLPENIKINRNDIYRREGIDRLRDRADSHLLKNDVQTCTKCPLLR